MPTNANQQTPVRYQAASVSHARQDRRDVPAHGRRITNLARRRKEHHQRTDRCFARGGGRALCGLRFILALPPCIGSQPKAREPIGSPFGLSGALRQCPNPIVPLHSGNLGTATCAQHPKAPRDDFHCAPNLESSGEGIVGFLTDKAAIWGHVPEVKGKYGVVNKTSCCAHREADQGEKHGMLYPAVSRQSEGLGTSCSQELVTFTKFFLFLILRFLGISAWALGGRGGYVRFPTNLLWMTPAQTWATITRSIIRLRGGLDAAQRGAKCGGASGKFRSVRIIGGNL